MSHWCRRDARGWLLAIHAQPGAKRTGVAGLHGDALKIRLASPPVDGKANDALIAFIAKILDVPRRAVTLARGETSREKLVHVADATVDPGRLFPREF